MTEKRPRRTRRPRLDATAHARLLEEIAKFDVPPASMQIAEAMRDLRAAITEPVADEDEGLAVPAPVAVDDAKAEEISDPPAVDDDAPETSDDQGMTPSDQTGADAPVLDAGGAVAADVDPPRADTMSAAEAGPAPQSATDPTPAPQETAVVLRLVSDRWAALRRIPVDAALLERNLVITASRTDPAHASFDVMRTRLVQAMAEKGWRRVAITSPTKGCGKSFTAVNLAITLSRYENSRTILMDMDLRHPALARYLGAGASGFHG